MDLLEVVPRHFETEVGIPLPESYLRLHRVDLDHHHVAVMENMMCLRKSGCSRGLMAALNREN